MGSATPVDAWTTAADRIEDPAPAAVGAVPTTVPVTVVIPAMNEAANLPHVLGRLPEGLAEVILVDGRSSDDTVAVARRLRPDIRVITQAGRGKGDALACGFAAATGQIIVMIDADGSTDPAEIPAYVQALLDGADFAKGSRFLPGGGSSDITWLRRAGNRVLSGTVNRLWGTAYTDLCYGFNAFWANTLERIAPDCEGFEIETLMNVRAASAGLRVVEVPSFEHDRIHGTSNLRVGRDGLRVLRTIIDERRRDIRRPAPDLLLEEPLGPVTLEPAGGGLLLADELA